ncbi:lysozyme inhibitor LprI family protein [Hyphobacterium sp.]|uniref:lysozyme inhibitor LprI family protein n=1 Tax=Hyphobacterium sp. TaxID=2004662 RepID=UPI003BAB643D
MSLLMFVAGLALQEAALPAAPTRPMIECSEHLHDDRAIRRCLDDLLNAAEDGLDAALDNARTEAREIDLDMPGLANATGHLDSAHTAWIAYRDAECARRASLMLIGEDGEAIATDCQIALTRARTRELIEQ